MIYSALSGLAGLAAILIQCVYVINLDGLGLDRFGEQDKGVIYTINYMLKCDGKYDCQ